jgi:hypothetical protein
VLGEAIDAFDDQAVDQERMPGESCDDQAFTNPRTDIADQVANLVENNEELKLLSRRLLETVSSTADLVATLVENNQELMILILARTLLETLSRTLPIASISHQQLGAVPLERFDDLARILLESMSRVSMSRQQLGAAPPDRSDELAYSDLPRMARTLLESMSRTPPIVSMSHQQLAALPLCRPDLLAFTRCHKELPGLAHMDDLACMRCHKELPRMARTLLESMSRTPQIVPASYQQFGALPMNLFDKCTWKDHQMQFSPKLPCLPKQENEDEEEEAGEIAPGFGVGVGVLFVLFLLRYKA